MKNDLKISVNQLLEIFSGAIISLIPWLEKAKIEWLNGKSYDDWDKIVTALYQNIVCSTITGEVLSEYTIAKYEFQYSDYSNLEYIQAHSKDYADKKLAFISFQNISSPCDYVKVAILDDFEKVIAYIDLPNNDLEYSLLKYTNGSKEKVKEVNILV